MITAKELKQALGKWAKKLDDPEITEEYYDYI